MSQPIHFRFRGTFNDLAECYDVLDEPERLSREEREGRVKLIRLCSQIAEDFGHEVAS